MLEVIHKILIHGTCESSLNIAGLVKITTMVYFNSSIVALVFSPVMCDNRGYRVPGHRQKDEKMIGRGLRVD